MATIWAKLDNVYIPLYFSDVTNSDFGYEEHRATVRSRRKEGVTPVGALEDHALIEVIAESEQIVKEAIKETKRARKTYAAKYEHETSMWLTDEVVSANALHMPNEKDKKPDYTKKAAPYSRRSR